MKGRFFLEIDNIGRPENSMRNPKFLNRELNCVLASVFFVRVAGSFYGCLIGFS